MKTVTIVPMECRETGSWGIAVKGIDTSLDLFVATQGRLVAHDLLEHLDGIDKIGDLEDELRALGALMYVRGWSYDWGRYSVGEVIASDLSFLFDQMDQDFLQRKVPRTCRLDDEVEQEIETALREAHKEFVYAEIKGNWWKDYAPRIRAQLRIGYRKARQRYAGHATWNAFDAIEAAANEMIRESGEDSFIKEWRLSYDYDGGAIVRKTTIEDDLEDWEW